MLEKLTGLMPRSMKNLVKTLAFVVGLLAFTLPAKASHLAGGDLWYEYLSSSGNNHTYRIKARLYRDQSGITMPGSIIVYACSALYNNLSTTLTQDANSGSVAPTLFDCVSQSNAGVTIEVYYYTGTITIPGNAPDWTFAWSSCCRNPAIDNIVNPASQDLYIEAKLNNMIGQNSSPEFVSEPVRAFCTGRTFNWKQSAVEPDGDSIYYRLSYVQGGQGSSCGGNDLAYNAGWSYDQPITTTPANSMVMNPNNGIITFTPAAVEIDVMAVTVDEYRWDNQAYLWRKIGEANRDMQIAIAGACTPQAQAGVQLDFQAPGIYPDPDNGLPTVDYDCLDTMVTLKFAVKLDCSSISPDGTDFRLTKPDGQALPIKAVSANCDANFEATEMTLTLYKPLSKNGKYILYSKVGNDGNTLLNKCGFPMDQFDTIQLNVTDCFEAKYDMENVTIDNDEHPIVEWSADTASYPDYLFQEWQIFRRDPGATNFTKVGTVFNLYKYFWEDQSVGPVKVDQDEYDYYVNMKLNDDMLGPTRNVHNILLENQAGPGVIIDPDTTVNLIWSTYNGWAVDSYSVVLQQQQGGAWVEWMHSHMFSPQNPVAAPDTTYGMYLELMPGEYRVCIKTQNPLDTQYTAYSNCLPIIITTPPMPDTVVVPNFITPNGDGTNDEFIIQNVEDYDDMSQMKVYNRWGDLVWKSDILYDNSNPWRGTNQNGTKLADGVYFYTIELVHLMDNFEYVVTGSVTVLDSQ